MLSEVVKKQFKGKGIYIINMLKHSDPQWLNKTYVPPFTCYIGEKSSKDLEYPELLEQKGREKTHTLLLDI